MDAKFRINSLEEYQSQYQLSTEKPEDFWAQIASHYQWQKP